jgi:phospholipase/carboxylesterase
LLRFARNDSEECHCEKPRRIFNARRQRSNLVPPGRPWQRDSSGWDLLRLTSHIVPPQESASMLIALSGPTRPPVAGGKPRRLVILLHGLGADGNDLIGLQQVWGQLLPEAEFVSPNAPFPCDMAPYGYQWFSVQDRTPEVVLAGVRTAAPMLDAFIDEELAKRGLEESDAALVGFSQGTMMSLYVGLRRTKPLAGILGYSGRLLAPELLASELRSRPPVLLVHGTEDPLVPFQLLADAEAALKAAGVPVETLACPGVEHAIDPEGLQRGGLFLRQVLA